MDSLKKIKALHQAGSAPVGDLETYTAIPSRSLPHIDPFLLLNHHGPQLFPPNNSGLPFGPHPHRGFETLTFILQGDIVHRDSVSGESRIAAGGIQWMTAGSGLIHEEVSSEIFKKEGGMEEVLQLWINLPSSLKMTQPTYTGKHNDEIPEISIDGGKGKLRLIGGQWKGVHGAVRSITDVFASTVHLQAGAVFNANVPSNHAILLYIVNGSTKVNGTTASMHQLVEFEAAGEAVEVEAKEDSTLIFCHGEPTQEPIVSYGPFVMNSEAEIRKAIADYQSGKLGSM